MGEPEGVGVGEGELQLGSSRPSTRPQFWDEVGVGVGSGVLPGLSGAEDGAGALLD